MGPGFNPANKSTGFPAVKEINQILQWGLSFTDDGGRTYQFSAGMSIDGRNTGDKLLLGASVTIPIRGK
jgi:hypothetical protein